MELRQTWTAPQVRRRIGHSLGRLLAFWLLPILGVVAVAFAISR